jgi:hypothetical protein
MAGPGPVSGGPFPGQPGPFIPPQFPQPAFPPPRPTRQTISRNKLLLIILIVCGVLVLAGGGVAFVLYNRATEIDRSTPTVAVRQFLRATFVDKDDDRVKLFTCRQWADERTTEVRGRFDPSIKVTWEGVVVQSQQKRQAVVTARMRLVSQGFLDFQDWRFDVVEENGWRVCGAGPA